MITKAYLKGRIAQLTQERDRVIMSYNSVIGELEKMLSSFDNTKTEK